MLHSRKSDRPVLGLDVDGQGRCRHWNSKRDIVAIRSPCCDGFFACYDCHVHLTGHAPQRWPEDSDAPAVQCGACTRVFSVRGYLESPDRCPGCKADFNPACARHHHLYFDPRPAVA